MRLIKVKYLGFSWSLRFPIIHRFPISFSCLPSQPCGLETNFFLKESWDSYTLSKFTWWASKENIHYQATSNKIFHQWHGVWGVVFCGLSARCVLLSGGWPVSSKVKANAGSLRREHKSVDWPHYHCRWVGYSTGGVPQTSSICIHLLSQEILFIFLTLKQGLSMLLPWQTLNK